MVVNVAAHLRVVFVMVWSVLVLPTAGSRDWEVVHVAWIVLASCEYIAHAYVILSVELAQLRYPSFVLLPLIELDVLRCRVNVFLQSPTLLGLWRVLRLLQVIVVT